MCNKIETQAIRDMNNKHGKKTTRFLLLLELAPPALPQPPAVWKFQSFKVSTCHTEIRKKLIESDSRSNYRNVFFILFCPVQFFSILFYSILFYSILFYSILFYSILFYSILVYSILLYSILFCSCLFYSILFYSILFYSILFYSILFYSILF